MYYKGPAPQKIIPFLWGLPHIFLLIIIREPDSFTPAGGKSTHIRYNLTDKWNLINKKQAAKQNQRHGNKEQTDKQRGVGGG